MELYKLPAPLYESLDRPLLPSFAAEWAVWGSVDESILPAGRNLVFVTGDETESRLLSGLPTSALTPFLALPWLCGFAIAGSLLADETRTWAQAIAAADGVIWINASNRSQMVTRPALVPKPWMTTSPAVRSLIRVALPNLKTPEVVALKAGWLQLADDLDGSHRCSQSIEGDGRHQSGDYWHAIMHRREPDYGNSQYWFHQFATHPVFTALPAEADRIAKSFASPKFADWLPRLTPGSRWNPIAFVNCCQAAANDSDEAFRAAVEELQYREMLLLLRQTLMDAVA